MDIIKFPSWGMFIILLLGGCSAIPEVPESAYANALACYDRVQAAEVAKASSTPQYKDADKALLAEAIRALGNRNISPFSTCNAITVAMINQYGAIRVAQTELGKVLIGTAGVLGGLAIQGNNYAKIAKNSGSSTTYSVNNSRANFANGATLNGEGGLSASGDGTLAGGSQAFNNDKVQQFPSSTDGGEAGNVPQGGNQINDQQDAQNAQGEIDVGI